MTKGFDAEKIRDDLSAELIDRLDGLQVFSRIDSTNSHLLRERPPAMGRFHVAIANHQTMGRGQFRRAWESPPHTGLCMSVAYTFARKPRRFAALSLALGTAVVTRTPFSVCVTERSRNGTESTGCGSNPDAQPPAVITQNVSIAMRH